jgi:glycosyltransferase involved in cell wall biosynthesis
LQENNYQGQSLSPIDYANVLSTSKIFLATTSPADLISTRYFEAMATNRTLIITNRMPKNVFENYLIEDFNCIMFATLDEFYEKVLYYLSHEEERLKIVNTAFTYFSENLTWKKQSENMTNIFYNYCPQTN